MEKLNVLIADDEDNIAQLLERILSSKGYNIFVANNGEEAFEIVKTNHIDIVLSDIRMPKLDGISLLKKIKDFDSFIEVLIMTAFADVETAIDAIKMGARDYIRKPFDLEEVVEAVDKAAMIVGHNIDNDMHEYQSDEILVAKSPQMQKLKKLIGKIAASMATVNIYGETGVGKELVAKSIHEHSDRKDKAFIKVNCSAFPETLLESELFGYEKGAFTGAFSKKLGRFELADGGTIFLDEIGDISPLIQLKLLRVIQQKEFERLGGTKTLPLDIRVITATNKNLKDLVKSGLFREDLYYRLNVIPVDVSPLRDRKEDIESLLNTFISATSKVNRKEAKKISKDALSALITYNWPGNVRELENIVERVMVISDKDTIGIDDLPEYIRTSSSEESSPIQALKTLKDEVEEQVIREAIDECSGNMTRAAEKLGISRRSLYRKVRKYEIET
ncbi:MAG: sigma-54 dependent transcriptional regulator [Acidaminobacteraceae bacterium]